MAPYKVALIPPKGDRLDMVLPFDGTGTFQDLTKAVLNRGAKHRSLPSTIRQEHLKLCLGSEDGFLIESQDTVQDIIAPSDVLFIIFQDASSAAATRNANGEFLSFEPTQPSLQIQIVTPNSAQRNYDHPMLLQGGRQYAVTTTLKQIKTDIAHQLHLPHLPIQEDSQRHACNCKLAELLVKRGVWEKLVCIGHAPGACSYVDHPQVDVGQSCARCSQPLTKPIVHINDSGDCEASILVRTDLPCGHAVHSKCSNGIEYECPDSCYLLASSAAVSTFTVISGLGQVEQLRSESPTDASLMAAISERHGPTFTQDKAVHSKGGRLVDGDIYDRLPVMAICASKRHSPSRLNRTIASNNSLPTQIHLDLHTIEGPINTLNMDLTLLDANLADLAINGVLTLYAVERKSSREDKISKGKDGMFTAASHWQMPQAQSERAMAALLSSLRVFTHIIGTEEYDDVRQNAILRIVHLLTKFPPTVRAVHILMDGKTLQPNESAALVQSLGAVAEELIPMTLIANDMTRSLEGARLVLGLILHTADVHQNKQLEAANALGINGRLPYITAYRTIDLRDIKTLEPITEPVLTTMGLVNRSVFNVFSSSSMFKDSPACVLTQHNDDDSQRVRVALLYGGATPEASFYEANALGEALHHNVDSDTRLDLKSYSMDIQYLASMCEETKLVVVAPRQLSGAKSPSLTMDRYGQLAVYTGRAACAAPGQDHSVFHPLTGLEETVDVNIIAQKLELIIRAREADGTNVFDLFSATFRRKDALPTELVVFCVDCSHSMNDSSDFADLDEVESSPGPSESSVEPDADLLIDDDDDDPITLDEIKTWLKAHESYKDMLEIIHLGVPRRPLASATEVLSFLRTLTGRHLTHLSQKQRDISRWATQSYSRRRDSLRELNTVRKIYTGLSVHEKSLSQFLAFTATSPSFLTKDFEWKYGDDIPKSTNKDSMNTVDLEGFYTIPEEYLCSISHQVFEDPVITVDGFNFDRKAIERWYRIRSTSPLTGLAISDTTLRRHEALANQIKAWVRADDVVQSLPSTPKRTRLSIRQAKTAIEFVAPSVRFTRDVPGSATLLDLYKIAFRGMRGIHVSFALYFGGVRLVCCPEAMTAKGIAGDQTITIVPNHVPQDAVAGNAAEEHSTLIKVYKRHDPANMLFSYWLPTHAQLTFGSIVFRQWRYALKSGFQSWGHDKTVWSDLRDAGDGTCYGSTNNNWSSLSKVVTGVPRVTIKANELLYENLKDLAKKGRAGSSIDLTTEDGEGSGDNDRYGLHRVLKVRLYDYVDPKSNAKAKALKQRTLTRMSVTKQVFSGLINRLVAYNFPTNVGLVTFGTTARITQNLTDVIENFRQELEKMDPEGDTSLWDALALGADHLVETAKKYPNVKKRIIVLSDGDDTSSSRQVNDVVRMLMQNGIVVDSVCIGNEENSSLRTVSYLTGGYKFVPKKIEDASALCELEPVLSIFERPPVYRQPLSSAISVSRLSYRATPDPVTRDQFPARRTHQNLNDSFVQIGKMEKVASQRLSQSSTVATTSIRSRRLLLEIRDIAAHPHPSYDVYVSETNMGFWKIVLQGPGESAYASGCFVLYLDMGEDYPRRAPQGRFVTPVFHPNVNRHGRICHSIFDRNWTVDTTNKQVLDTVFGLLLVPEFSDPINTVVTLNYYWDEVAFKDEVEKHIRKHANKTRQVVGAEILGNSAGTSSPAGNAASFTRSSDIDHESFGSG